MNYALKVIGMIAVLYGISFGISYFFDFLLANVVFIASIVGGFIAWGGGASSLGEAATSQASNGAYVGKKQGNNNVPFITPFFVGAILTLLSSFFLYF
ncbi:hypothetical protein FLK61_36025 [Paenalkalicoccus suaedae]|uniref:Uncharacterized protein n=1 Tax=Paenalkalicoccus suaedae TaxID=2592382 RepID=A0A859FHE1_9BACI|nr:hypothetical protein [Paenalkalicoccus suaedae]QKS72072.1 hypothetical protein FLK61_36025 [Paenalkalicoccus suaedae]